MPAARDAAPDPRGAAKHEIEIAPFLEIVDDTGDDIRPVHRPGRRRRSSALRRYAGTGVPVFAVNYGEVGFLATIDPDGLAEDFERAFSGEFGHDRAPDHLGRPPRRHLERPQRHLRAPQGGPARRRPRLRARGGGDRPRPLRRPRGVHAARLHGLQPRQRRPRARLGRGGLRRLLHRAPLADRPRPRRRPRRRAPINNASREEPVEVHVDRRPTLELQPGEDIHVAFGLMYGTLAQLPGASFYPPPVRRFGRLAR